jgi:chromosome partitioning protein
MKILVIANQKGGVGKTTTAAALGTLLSQQGRGVHLIDMDPQASLTSTFGKDDPDGLLYEALASRGPLPIVEIADHLTLTPSSIDLASGEMRFVAQPGREYLLRTCLHKTPLPEGTTVIVDSPPSLGVLSTNTLAAATDIVIVLHPGGYEMRALARFIEVMEELKELGVNPTLSVAGVILTNCQHRRRINDQVDEEVSRIYPVLGRIRAEADLMYATTDGNILNLKRSNAMDDYRAVIEKLKEVIRGE